MISLKIISPVFPGANGETFSALEVNLLPQHPSSARERRRLKQRALESAVRMRTDRCNVRLPVVPQGLHVVAPERVHV